MQSTTTMSLAEAHVSGLDLVRQHTVRFADYVTRLDERALARPISGSDWTVTQTIAHLSCVYLRYTTDHRRADTPEAVAVQNSDDLEQSPPDVQTSIAAMHAQLDFLAQIVTHIPPERTFPFHANQQITMAGGWGNLIGELLAHGDDIAGTTGRPFAIPSKDTEILWRFTAPVLQGWLGPDSAGVTDSWQLNFPFGPIAVRFDDGRLHWNEEVPTQVDYILDIDDAAEFALAFPYRRRNPQDPLLAKLARRFLPL